MSDIIETIQDGNNRIEIMQDFSPESPRKWENLGTMACSHRRYNLGDEQIQDEESLLDNLMERYLPASAWNWYDENRYEWMKKNFDKYYIALPLYLYDHSGITMRTSMFSSSWDSGQVGIIYVSKEKVRKEFNWKLITKKQLDQIKEYLKGEVTVYDQYLTGDVYGFRVVCNTCGEELDSCWGFYGSNWKENGLLEYAQGHECENCAAIDERLKFVCGEMEYA